MAYDFLTKKQSQKDWSCGIAAAPPSRPATDSRAMPQFKKLAVTGVAVGAVAAAGYLFLQGRRKHAVIQRRLAWPGSGR